MVSLHRRVREEAPCHVLIEEFLHTLFRRCNKTASERVLLEYPYTRGSENLPKKMQKNRNSVKIPNFQNFESF